MVAGAEAGAGRAARRPRWLVAGKRTSVESALRAARLVNSEPWAQAQGEKGRTNRSKSLPPDLRLLGENRASQGPVLANARRSASGFVDVAGVAPIL